jgi:hypothetical protein
MSYNGHEQFDEFKAHKDMPVSILEMGRQEGRIPEKEADSLRERYKISPTVFRG